jgi:hypothetical protein
MTTPLLLLLLLLCLLSALQIGLFAVPFVTIMGWILGHPFSLGFDPFAALVLLLSVMHSAHMINDAESHWCVLCMCSAVWTSCGQQLADQSHHQRQLSAVECCQLGLTGCASCIGFCR